MVQADPNSKEEFVATELYMNVVTLHLKFHYIFSSAKNPPPLPPITKYLNYASGLVGAEVVI